MTLEMLKCAFEKEFGDEIVESGDDDTEFEA